MDLIEVEIRRPSSCSLFN